MWESVRQVLTAVRNLASGSGTGAGGLAIVGGVALGIAIGTGVVLAGVFDQPTSAATVALFRCPQPGTPILRVAAGQNLLLTGRTADASWLEVHVAEPAIERAWVTAADVRVQGDVRSLPVVACGRTGRGTPTGSTTLISVAQPTPTATPSPSPTITPSVSPSPSVSPAVVDTITLTDPRADPPSLNTGDRVTCPAGRATTISVNATSNVQVASVTLLFRRPGETTDQPRPMAQQPGGSTWTATLDADLDVIKDGPLTYHVVALTGTQHPVQAVAPASGEAELDVHVCAAPESIALNDLDASPDPLTSGDETTCPTGRSSTISVTATSRSTVTKVTLFFRRPGDGTEHSRAMRKQGSTDRWTAVLSADTDRLASGPVLYRVEAVGGTGNAVRALSPANGRTVPLAVHVCPPPATIRLANLRATPDPFNSGDRLVCPTGRSTSISVSATSDRPFESVTLLFRRPGDGSDVARTMQQRPGTTTWTYNLTADGDRVTAGPVRYRVRATTAGEGARTAFLPARGYQSVAVKVCPPDTTGPVLSDGTVIPRVVSLCTPTDLLFSVRAVDPAGVGSIVVRSSYPSLRGDPRLSPTSTPGVWSVRIRVDSRWVPGAGSFRFIATDMLKNRTIFPPSDRSALSFQVQRCDRLPPQISTPSVSSSFLTDRECSPSSVTISADVTDDVSVGSVTIRLTDADGKTSGEMPMRNASGNTWTVTIDRDGWAYGTLRYHLTAMDGANHTASADGSLEVRKCPDTTPPTVDVGQSNPFLTMAPCKPTSVSWTVDASDSSGIDKVVFTLGDPDNPLLRRELSKSGSLWTITLTRGASSPTGMFRWQVDVYDVPGNRASVMGTLDIRDCPDEEPPHISDFSQSGSVVTDCQVTFKVFATDNVGIDHVVFTLGDRTSPLTVRTMTKTSSNSWSTTFSSAPSWPAGTYSWFIDVFDAAGNRATVSGTLQVQHSTCDGVS